MFGVVWDYYSSKLKEKQYKQNISPKSYKSEIKILANPGFNRVLNNSAQMAKTGKIDCMEISSDQKKKNELQYLLIELEFGDVGFCGGRRTGEPEKKPSEQDEN